jgi:hypothetical protein
MTHLENGTIPRRKLDEACHTRIRVGSRHAVVPDIPFALGFVVDAVTSRFIAVYCVAP